MVEGLLYKTSMNFDLTSKILVANAFKNGLDTSSIASVVGCAESEVKDLLNEVFNAGNALFGRFEARNMQLGTISKVR